METWEGPIVMGKTPVLCMVAAALGGGGVNDMWIGGVDVVPAVPIMEAVLMGVDNCGGCGCGCGCDIIVGGVIRTAT